MAGVTHYGVRAGQTNSLSIGMVKGLTEDRTGALWVGLWEVEEGLNRIDRETGRVSRWRIPSVTSITEDHSGGICVGSKYVGLNPWNPASVRISG